MRVVVPFLALLLAGLGPFFAMADDEAAAAAVPSKEMKAPPTHLRPHDQRPGRGPIVTAPMVGGKEDVTGSNDEHLSEVSQFAADHLKGLNSGLTYIQVKAEVQVVAGMVYTLHYKGNDSEGACKEERVLVVYDKPWVHERVLKSDTVAECT
eukprot:g8862.t1